MGKLNQNKLRSWRQEQKRLLRLVYNIDMKFFKILLFSTLSLAPLSTFAQSVDILWEGRDYSTPFYEGGVPWGKEGAIRFVAVPQGLGDSRNLFFKWSRNGTVLGNTNGVGVSVLNLTDSIFSKPQTIGVEVLDSNQNSLAQNSLVVAPQDPSILVYEKSPLYGFMFNNEASAGVEMKDNEIVLGAFPFIFHTPSSVYERLSYTWRSGVGEDSREQLVTYRAPEGRSGQTQVNIKVKNQDSLMQEMTKGFLIKFGQEQ